MKRKLSILISLVFTLSFVIGLAPVYAIANTSYPTLYVEGVRVTEENADNVLPGGDNDGKVSFDVATNTLSLNGANIANTSTEGSADMRSGVMYNNFEVPLVISVSGDNYVDGKSYGICNSGALVIRGTGTLTVTNKSGVVNGGRSLYAATSLTLEGGVTVNVYGPDILAGSAAESFAIEEETGLANYIRIGDGCTLNAYAGKMFDETNLSDAWSTSEIYLTGSATALFKGNEESEGSGGARVYYWYDKYDCIHREFRVHATDWTGTLTFEGNRGGLYSNSESYTVTYDNTAYDMLGYVTPDSEPVLLGDASYRADDTQLGRNYKKVVFSAHTQHIWQEGFCARCGVKNIEDATVTPDEIADEIYSGSAIMPALSLNFGDDPLVLDTDYTVAYKDNVNCGTATVTITGKGDYAGTIVKSFKIKLSEETEAEINEFRATAATTVGYLNDIADPERFTPETYAAYKEAYDAYSTLILEENDQDTIKEIRKARSEVTRTFILLVERTSITKATVDSIAAKTYTGKAQTPAPVVTLGDTTLVKGTDYTVTYKNNKNAGTATVTITGINNYNGTISKTFKINKAANPMTAKAKKSSYTISLSKVTKAAQTVASPITVSKAQGTVTYKKSSGSSNITVDSKTGKLTVKKGTKKGTYTIKVQVKAAGNTNYNAATKTVTLKVIVK